MIWRSSLYLTKSRNMEKGVKYAFGLFKILFLCKMIFCKVSELWSYALLLGINTGCRCRSVQNFDSLYRSNFDLGIYCINSSVHFRNTLYFITSFVIRVRDLWIISSGTLSISGAMHSTYVYKNFFFIPLSFETPCIKYLVLLSALFIILSVKFSCRILLVIKKLIIDMLNMLSL